jgi:predicted benzoate:H+ symporter BenE
MAVDLTRISKIHVGLLGATGGVAYATHFAEPGSILLGGAVMGANFYLLRLITNLLRPGAFDPEKRWRVTLAVAAFVLKFGLFLALLAALFWHLPIEGMSFALGVTLLLVACVLEVAHQELFSVKGVG